MKKNSLYTEQINRHVTKKGKRKKIGLPIQILVTGGSTILALVAVIGISSILSRTKISETSAPVIEATQLTIPVETTKIEQDAQIPDAVNTSNYVQTEVLATDLLEEESLETDFDSDTDEIHFAAPQTQATVWRAPPSPQIVETPKSVETVPQPTAPQVTTPQTTAPSTNSTPASATEKITVATTPETAAAVETKPKAPTEKEVWGTLYAKEKINVRSGPGKEFDVVKTLNTGEGVDVVALTENGWYRSVKGTYVSAEYVVTDRPATTATETSANPTTAPTSATQPETKPSSSAPPAPASPAPVDPAGSDLATYARSFIGTPYVFAGGSPSTGFDCSGFVKYIYKNFYGITLTHQSNAILRTGTEVSASDIQVGDVVCYDYSKSGGSDHVAVYIGNGSVVHASNNRSNVVETSFSTKDVVSIRRITG